MRKYHCYYNYYYNRCYHITVWTRLLITCQKCLVSNQIKWGGVIGTMCVSVCVGHVCFCCPAKVVQPTRVGRYGEELPRSASQPVRVSRDERGGGGGRSAKAHIKQTGIMEKRSPLRRTLPSNGVRLLTSLLALYGLTCEYSVYLSFLSALTYFFSGS